MLNAYAIRKMVPRLVIGVILINLSIYLCVAMIDLTDIVGKGLGDLLRSPFIDADTFQNTAIKGNATNSTAVGVGAVGVGAVLANVIGLGSVSTFTAAGAVAGLGNAALGILGLVAVLLLPLVFVALAVLITLAVRYGLIIFLTIVSPIAIACMILPSTEKYFRQWWSLFLKTLLVYPIIAILFAMSDIMAAIFLNAAASDDSSGGEGLVAILVAVIAICAPIFMIPFAFKFSGGVLASVYDMANKGTGRAGGAILGDKNDPDSFISRLSRKSQSRRVEAGLTGRQIGASLIPRKNYRGNLAQAKELDMQLAKAAEQKSVAAQMNAQNSDAMDSMVMTKEEVAADRAKQKAVLASSTSTSDQKKVAKSKLASHDAADYMGRTAANQQAAFHSVDRIKFLGEQGEEGHTAELERAKRIFGDEASVASAMNYHQALAKGQAGRADLAGSLYGQEYSAEKAGSHVSGSEFMSQQHTNGLEGHIKEQVKVLNDDSKSYKEKVTAAKRLASLRAAGNGPYAREANKAVLASYGGDIDKSFERFAEDPNMHAQAQIASRKDASTGEYEEDIFTQSRSIGGTVTRKENIPSGEEGEAGEGVEVTIPLEHDKDLRDRAQETLTGKAAASQWWGQQTGRGISPDEAAAAAAAAAGGAAAGGGATGGGAPGGEE